MILSGKEVADHVYLKLKERLSALRSLPTLAVLLIGENPSSQTYVKKKREACEKIGIRSQLHALAGTISKSELLTLIGTLNQNPSINGILLQLPLPAHIDPVDVIQAIDPKKDVDGLHPLNLGKILTGLNDGFTPCTPLGIKTLLEHYRIAVEGKNVVIAGRSAIVGKPLAALLMQNAPGCNATVTVVHSRTPNLSHFTSQADILIAAVGRPRMIKKAMVKKGAVVIDVGINREGSKLVGDVDFEEVRKKCQAITPVPGGVGPMTVAMLLHNTLLSSERVADHIPYSRLSLD